MSQSLSRKSIASLPDHIFKPQYQFKNIHPGIIHLGLGNFHRAHQALYLDDLFNIGLDHDWGIVGSGVMPHDASMRKALLKQDLLTTVVELEPGANKVRIIGSMVDFLPVESGNPSLIRALCNPEIRIVSMTITEGGYFIDPATGMFNPNFPQMIKDSKNLETPDTVFGVLVQALKLRRQKGLPPFTVMSCDNLPGNGKVTKDAVVGLADLSDSKFARWIEQEVSFPNGMVDRIATVTTDQKREKLISEFGIDDQWPVFLSHSVNGCLKISSLWEDLLLKKLG